MCEHREQLQKAAFELELMLGTKVLDLGKLRQILNQPCEHGELT
jgi:hypothetical protein